MTDDDRFVTERDLAGTYDGGTYDDAYKIVQQYRRVVAYQADHPDKGYVATANALELPRGRVRSWDDGKTPNVVEGIRRARERGWLEVGYDDEQFTALNALVANVYSGGSILPNWQPTFVLNERGYRSHAIDALELAGVGHTVHEDDPDDVRGPVVRPGADGAILGRVLHVLGAPLGKKSEIDDFSLPAYLEGAPDDTRETFVHSYLANRGAPDTTSDSIQIVEERPPEYRQELAALIESVAGAPVRAGEESVTISAEAARNLGSIR
ncbi:hypothetical protein [Halobiforma nitratireducens]|uniref:Uncharacterized protein n=1 Tax=Halobiforma nitratireducens JCM 10879 TaxID=1227454 RepID=M0L2I9_9EURY|nr:hypothetical protein [Halobiforma nitratireducens]EMA27313.1 hypothetical protein C446_17931 [Halobiforma nitratireducens JCM 10879]